MAGSSNSIACYLEIGSKRTFAAALDWPGWCRSGRDEPEALRALVVYAPRYARAIATAGVPFQAPGDLSAFKVVERLDGSSGTDFGAPGAVPAQDAQPLDAASLERLQALLKACWRAFEETCRAAQGKPLRLGPRGGGRQVDAIALHVLNAEAAYLARLGGKPVKSVGMELSTALAQSCQAALDTLALAVNTPAAIPAPGPRGGARWTPRYFVRRSAWHLLDHAWEIEDRV